VVRPPKVPDIPVFVLCRKCNTLRYAGTERNELTHA
jgi:hypothetical protein